MSYDFALRRMCQHQVLFELADFDPLRDTVTFQRPPLGQSVNLYVDGTFVPSDGLFSNAEVAFTNAEPYRIVAGQSDLIYFGFGNAVPRFVQLLPGPAVKAADLARDLALKLPELRVSVRKKHVVLTSRTPFNGPAFILPDPRWTDRTSSSPITARVLGGYRQLGIVPGRVASGIQIVPGYDIIQDPSVPLDLPQFRILKFRSPFPHSNPLIQVSYVTSPSDCRRCQGTRIEYDYGVVDGTYETVQDTDLLAQELDKFMFTKLGSHWKWTWLGSNLINRIGGKGNTAQSNIGAMISLDVSQAFRVYQNIKSQQVQRFPFQQVSDAEYPAILDTLDVSLLPNDPTVAIVSATVRSKSRVPVPARRLVGNPNPFTLEGDPTLNIQIGGDPTFSLRG